MAKKKTKNLLIKDIMEDPVSIQIDDVLDSAAKLASDTQASDLMVVDAENRFIGVLSEGDMIRAVLPNFEEITHGTGSLEDAFQIFVESGKDLAKQPFERLIIRNPILLKPDEELLRAATVMIEKMIRRLPVVDNSKLIGTVSRSDICRAILLPKAPRRTHAGK